MLEPAIRVAASEQFAAQLGQGRDRFPVCSDVERQIFLTVSRPGTTLNRTVIDLLEFYALERSIAGRFKA